MVLMLYKKAYFLEKKPFGCISFLVFLCKYAHIAIIAHPPAAAIKDANCGVPRKFINQSKRDIVVAALTIGKMLFFNPFLPSYMWATSSL